MSLNPEQEKAASHGSGPFLLVAGAGTGKTTVISQRFLRLVKNGQARPEEILALSFTEKATGEMEERIESGLALGHLELWISTFHSCCERILKDYGLDIGLPGDFKPIDQTRAWLLTRRNLEKFKLNYYRPLGNPAKFIHSLLQHFSRLKDEAIYPEDYLKYADELKEDLTTESGKIETGRIRELANAFHTYQNLLLKNSLLDFGDLINYTVKLFKTRPQILETFRESFKYLMVDEFQDTNFSQYELVKLISAPNNNLFVSADDDQAIYRWRGASFNNVLQFTKDFPKAKRVVLKQNYRSQQNILDLAYNFIQKNNPNRLECRLQASQQIKKSAAAKGLDIKNFQSFDKKLVATKTGQAKIEHLHWPGLDQETKGVAQKILLLKTKNKNVSWNDFAILVRANHSALAFCESLEKAGIPYQYLAARGLYTKAIILDVIAYFKLLDNYHENLALYRVLNFPFLEIAESDIAKITQFARRKTQSVYETLERVSLVPGVSAKGKTAALRLIALIQTDSQMARQKRVEEVLISFLKNSGYLEYLSQGQALEKKENIRLLNLFLEKIRAFTAEEIDPSLKNFMAQLNLELESGDQGKLDFDPEEGPEMVRVMTVHAAKGLEFKYVFVVSLVDKRFPSIRREETIQIPEALVKEILPEGDFHLQDERRLFYVAMTRAKAGLYLTSAKNYGGLRPKKPSLFLSELGFSHRSLPAPKKITLPQATSPLDQARVSKLEPPKYFSFSQLSLFKRCPYQYYLQYVLRLPMPGMAVFSYGQTIHNTLYRFLGEQTRDKTFSQKNLFSPKETSGKKSQPTLDRLLEIYKAQWIDDWFESKEQKKAYQKQGRQSLKNFFRDSQNEPLSILKIQERPALELSFALPLGEYIIRGKIDRISKNKIGEIEIMDYKTGREKKRLETEDKLQLLLYQIASEEVLAIAPKRLIYYYLDTGAKLEFIGSAKEKQTTKEEILRRIKKIEKGKFPCLCREPSDLCRYAPLERKIKND